MVNKLKLLNILSAAAFIISALSLLYIPFISSEEKLSRSSYVVAAVFWIGLLLGIIIQIILYVKCRKLKRRSKKRIHRIPLLISAIAFVVLLLLIILRSQSSVAVIIALITTMISLEMSVIIKRREFLR